MTTLTYEVMLTEDMLGSKPSNAEVFTDYIAAGKQDGVDPEELAAAKAAEERVKESMTVFHRSDKDTEIPIIWNYQVLGFFKDACGALRRVEGTRSKGLTAYKTVIDGNIFVKPRKIDLQLPEDGKIGVLERPLRADTAQGPRVALAKSETVPAGTKFTFQVLLLNPKHKDIVEEWMKYGELRGFGSWRNAGYGSFTYRLLEEKNSDEE